MAIKIPLVVTTDKDLHTFQTQLAKSLQPVLSNPINLGTQLTNVSLINGVTVVNHMLGRPLQGWFLTRVRAQCQVWDSQDTNASPAQTLILNSSAAAVVDMWCY